MENRGLRMALNRRMLVMSISFMALFLAIHPTFAITQNPPNHHKTWIGIQEVGMPFDDY